jgi:hypothetical protein
MVRRLRRRCLGGAISSLRTLDHGLPHDVRVQILSLSKPDSGGQFQLDWAGEDIPLCWSHQRYKPRALTIPPSDVVDLFSIQKESHLGGPHTFKLHPLFRSFALQADWTEPFSIAIVVQAKSTNGESAPMRVEISWDGNWSDNPGQMKRHLTWALE